MRAQHRIGSLLLSSALAVAACSGEKPARPATAPPTVELGAKIFNRTQLYTTTLGGNALACTNCHIDGGRKAGSLPLESVARKYPMKEADGRTFTLDDRIARCFTHSLAGKAPGPASPELEAVAAYVRSLSEGSTPRTPAAGQRSTEIAAKNRMPMGELNPARGRMKYDEFCSGCHGLDGQGYREKRTPLPYDYVPPVWGPRSYDDAAGLARVYTLAGFVRHAMPWDDPGTINDHDAQEIAAFVNGQPRPTYADKGDWDGTHPVDAVYDTKLYPTNPFFVPLDQ